MTSTEPRDVIRVGSRKSEVKTFLHFCHRIIINFIFKRTMFSFFFKYSSTCLTKRNNGSHSINFVLYLFILSSFFLKRKDELHFYSNLDKGCTMSIKYIKLNFGMKITQNAATKIRKKKDKYQRFCLYLSHISLIFIAL